MTTYFRQDVTCANCGQSSEHHALGSTNAFGSPDLDLRPPEMQRSTMRAWLQHCPHCGYVAPNLSRDSGDRAVVSGTEYRQTLSDRRFPELARHFLAYALLFDSLEPLTAAHARLNAAWVCDDTRQTEQASECRSRAAEILLARKPFEDNEQGITQGAILVDILRRAGQLDLARGECDSLLACENAVDVLRQVLEFQRRLIDAGDTAAHRVEECTRPQ